ncbi:MAG: hypothetical protein GY710_08630 [Desulfobacteraceae bacterium]|nr:hypothetical protein [Desulfobacteraceae bacterium]
MKLKIYFDGTGINLNSSVEADFGRSVIGEAFINNSGKDLDEAQSRSRRAPAPCRKLTSRSFKLYLPGVGSKTSTYNNTIRYRPGSIRLNKGRTQSTALLSSHKVKNRTGIYSDGWEHSQQEALVKTINAVMELHKPGHLPVEIKIYGYSRGGITAIAFSNALSKIFLHNKNVVLKAVHLIDPVAGADYGKFQKCVERKKYKNNLRLIEPLKLGFSIKKLSLFIATQEKRNSFKPQMPVGIDQNDQENNRPLLIPDSVETKIILAHGCHQTIAYPEYTNRTDRFKIGMDIYELITGRPYYSIKEKSTLEHFANDSWLRKRDRVLKGYTSHQKLKTSFYYSDSVLYDCYQTFLKNCDDRISFYDAFTDKTSKYHKIVRWAYQNSNFYRCSKIEPDDIPEEVLAHAVQCKSRVQSALNGILGEGCIDAILKLDDPVFIN